MDAAYAVKDGKLIHHDNLATMSVQEHHGLALEALHSQKWEELIKQATIIIKNFSGTPFSQEAQFFLGKGYLELKDYDLANRHFTQYLKRQGAPKHFVETMEGKLCIAENFSKGAGKHLMGWETMPKWLPAYDEALKIFDEVATAMPNHEMAARALMGKSLLLYQQDEYKSGIEHLHTLIRRFPNNDLAAEAFMEINRFYLKQVQKEFPDPGLLELAEINMRKFYAEFPGDRRLETAQNHLHEMQELFAERLFDTGQFFERTKKPHAALIYYARIQRDFPVTQVAKRAQGRIAVLKPETPASGEIVKNETK